MLIGFLDDTELVLDPEDSSPDVFAIGGYFIRLEQLNDFQNRIQQVKDGYGFPPQTPVKWNLKDTGIKRFCTGDRWLSEDVTGRLLQYSFNIRRDLLSLIGEFDARIFISARYDHHWRETTHAEFYGWAFENLLQRVGLMFQRQDLRARENSSTILVMDWPQNEVGKDFFDLYQGGYHFGYGLATHQNYFSGRLSDFHLLDSLTHASTYHSGPLQIADLVVGCCRDFLNWAYRGRGEQKIRGMFDLLIGHFDTDSQGRVNDCGFKIAKDLRVNIDQKIQEYIELIRQREAEEDIPF